MTPEVGDTLCSTEVLPEKRTAEAEVVRVEGSMVTFKWLPDHGTLIGADPDKEITINWFDPHYWMIFSKAS